MTALTIQDVSRRSGLSEPTLRYYEEVGLVGPVGRDDRSGHRRYGDADLDAAQALAYLREKSSLWDARAQGDATAESAAQQRVHAALSRLDMETEIKR